jgi:hypothetical protein
MEWKYAAFIYIENNKTCLCGSEEYTNNVEYASSDENTDIVYGVRKTTVLSSYVQVIFI